MKVAFSFALVSALIFVSQQQNFPYQRSGQTQLPWNYRDQFDVQDFYDYLHARSLMQQLQPQQVPENLSRNVADSLSISEDPLQDGRFFFNFVTTVGSSTTSYNYLKTIYYISTTTATTTSVKTCVPAASFSATQYTVACRKRREVMGMLMGMNADDDVPSLSPSSPVSVEKTVAALSPRSLDSDAIVLPFEIASSKTDEYLVEKGIFSDIEQAREKRFLIASTTITSYTFVTTSTTKTLSNIGSSLSCLPSQFALC